MCVGIPMVVVEPQGTQAWCDGREGRRLIDMALVGPQSTGTWVLTFIGAAREVMTAEAAAAVDRALDSLAAILAGEDGRINEAFADLVNRTPELPEHLRPKEKR